MKYRYRLYFIQLFIVLNGYSQNQYSVSLIPKELKENSAVVVRSKEVKFTINSTSSSTLHSFEAITILNVKGRGHSIKAIFYDKLSKVVSLSASVYDGNGVLVKKLKSGDFEDRSAISGFSLYEDSRAKVADLSTTHYPFTIELEYEQEFKYLFIIPSFHPVWDEHMSAQFAKYTLSFPTGERPRFKLNNIDRGFDFYESDKEVKWSFKNIQSFTQEKYGPPWSEIIPEIKVAPTKFEYDGYSGNMQSWESFGSWIKSLNENRNELPAKTKLKVSELTEGLNSIEEKSRALYEYLQNKTRYVSIQLGIGGYQPFEAKLVDEVGYGDCKALSNYMIALLGEAGIKANYNLIKAGSDASPIDVSFPSSQFNHVIVSVPNGADTLWLECTSQTNPFNYLGSFTRQRHALSITEEGATMVKTPDHKGDNAIRKKLVVQIDEKGSATINCSSTYHGNQYEYDNLNYLSSSNLSEQKKWIERSIKLPSFHIENFTFENYDSKLPKVDIVYILKTDRLVSINGKRIFLEPNILSKRPVYFSSPDGRTSDVIIKRSIVEYDSIEFNIPETLYAEYIPENKSISNQFGSYEVTYTLSGGKMIYCRKFILKEGRYAVEDYPALCDFNKEVSRTDNIKMAFLKKT